MNVFVLDCISEWRG